ncbi:MAG: HAD family hydrolase [Pseudomonadota bacterium]|nr:HAD family hydrolase [Pseudomonadota bacterium]HJO36291.1 HAD family hydrolase [Gammaproteobacteria bacterium]
MTPCQAVSFDLDDTFWDVMPVLQRAERAVNVFLQRRYPRMAERLANPGIRARMDELALHRPELAHHNTELRLRALRRVARESDYPALAGDAAFAVFRQWRSRVTLYPEVLPTLRRLRPRRRLATLTNGNADLRRIGIAHLFERRLSAEDLGVAKPDPQAFDSLFAALALPPPAVWHVGDHPECDVIGAREAGAVPVWYNPQARPWTHAGPAPLQIRSLTELPALLDPAG